MPDNNPNNTNTNNRGKMTVAEAGRAGGKKTAATHGSEFYRAIGREGGKKSGKRRSRKEDSMPNLYPDGHLDPDK